MTSQRGKTGASPAGAAGRGAQGLAKDEVAASLRLRFAPADARYGRGLIAGAKVMEIFGDLETEIAIREGGDEGLCAGYEFVEFLEPLFVGDFIEAKATVVAAKGRRRSVDLELFRVVAGHPTGTGTPLSPPVLAARARANVVVETASRVEAAQADGGRG